MEETKDDDVSVNDPMAKDNMGTNDAGDAKGIDKMWSGLHADKLQQMLNELNSLKTSYTILKHRFGRGKSNKGTLYLKVQNDLRGDIVEITAKDAKVDFPHALAEYIRKKRMKGDYSVTWKKWADEHFKRVRVLFRRIERTFGMSSYSSVQQMGSTLAEIPAIGSHIMVKCFQRIAKKVSW